MTERWIGYHLEQYTAYARLLVLDLWVGPLGLSLWVDTMRRDDPRRQDLSLGDTSVSVEWTLGQAKAVKVAW